MWMPFGSLWNKDRTESGGILAADGIVKPLVAVSSYPPRRLPILAISGVQGPPTTRGRTHVLTTTQGLTQIRSHYTVDTKYLFRIVLNATSVVEANIALDLLHKTVPERSLVTTINLREVFKSLPASPFQMAVDEQTLLRVARLHKHLAAYSTTTPDGYEVVVTTAGNLILDLIVKRGDEKFFWTPMPRTSDYIAPPLIDHLVESEYLLDRVIEVVKAMGVVFNPKFYLSIDDWHLEYASETMEGLGELF